LDPVDRRIQLDEQRAVPWKVDFGNQRDAPRRRIGLEFLQFLPGVSGLAVRIPRVYAPEDLGRQHPVLIVGQVELEVSDLAQLRPLHDPTQGGRRVVAPGHVDHHATKAEVGRIPDHRDLRAGGQDLAQGLHPPRHTRRPGCPQPDRVADGELVLLLGEGGDQLDPEIGSPSHEFGPILAEGRHLGLRLRRGFDHADPGGGWIARSCGLGRGELPEHGGSRHQKEPSRKQPDATGHGGAGYRRGQPKRLSTFLRCCSGGCEKVQAYSAITSHPRERQSAL